MLNIGHSLPKTNPESDGHLLRRQLTLIMTLLTYMLDVETNSKDKYPDSPDHLWKNTIYCVLTNISCNRQTWDNAVLKGHKNGLVGFDSETVESA